MPISNIQVQQRDEARLYVQFDIDGEPWGDGSVPVGLLGNEAAILAYLAEKEDDLWSDRQRKLHPDAAVIPSDEESRRAAWERVLAAGVDDADNPL